MYCQQRNIYVCTILTITPDALRYDLFFMQWRKYVFMLWALRIHAMGPTYSCNEPYVMGPKAPMYSSRNLPVQKYILFLQKHQS
jgi:hypothetical protein